MPQARTQTSFFQIIQAEASLFPEQKWKSGIISKSVMKSQSGRLLRNTISRRSGLGFSKKRAERRTKWIFLAGENALVDDSTWLIGLNVLAETEMLTRC